MNSIQSNIDSKNSETEPTLRDLFIFIFSAKWFSLLGIVIGLLIAATYSFNTPNIYQSRVVVQIQPSFTHYKNFQINASSDEIMERLLFANAPEQIFTYIEPTSKSITLDSIRIILNSSTLSKGGTFLTLLVSSDSATTSQKLAGHIGDAIISFVTDLNQARIASYEKILNHNKIFISQNHGKIVNLEFIALTNDLELNLNAIKSTRPKIVDGPTLPNNTVAKKTSTMLILGAFCGFILGLLLFYLKNIYLARLKGDLSSY
jgi:uncharacterized protein YacL